MIPGSRNNVTDVIHPDSGVAVIGGGIAGASVTAHLAQLGRPVTMYERGDIGEGTTAKSAAFFGEYGSELEQRLKRYGMRLYNDLCATDAADFRYDHVGRFRVATTGDGATALREYADTHTDVRALDRDEIHECVFAPHLDSSAIELATYRPHVGFFRPRPLATALVERAKATHGTSIHTDTPVETLVNDGDRVTGILVDGEHVRVDHVVCAAGPWNPGFLEDAGVDLPVSHSLAPILRVDLHEPSYTLPIITHHETGVYVRGDDTGSALLGRYPPDPDPEVLYDPDEVPDRVPQDLAETIRTELATFLPAVSDAPLCEEWVGIRTHTPDGHPIAGRVTDGLSVAAFNSSGIQLAPAVGRVIARLLDGLDDDQARALTLERFED